MTDHDRRPPLRVAFHTLGCRLNQYDTEGIKAAMRGERPIEVVAWDETADLYLLNSCTVTGKADQECRRLARQVKRRHPDARVVVAGCYAQTQPQDLAAVSEIDGVVGNTAKDQVARWLPAVLAGAGSEPPVVVVEDFERGAVLDTPLIEEFEGRSRAFVKIQDGCDLRCSYCLIWQARGPGRSRSLEAVLDQIGRLHRTAGYNELVLTGVHMGSWGRDLAEPAGLLELVAAVCDVFPDLRIRLSSIHPNEVSPQLLALVAARPQLRPHLHISLQSGSDTVLARMKRPYRGDTARSAVARVAAAVPGCGLGADLIVGFPGESEREFADTVAMVENLPFTYLHVFRYSPRPGTPAARLEPVHPEAVSERSRILRAVGRRKHEAFLQEQVGQRREAVIENPDGSADGRRLATTDNYAAVTVATDLPAGTLVEVAPDRWHEGRLYAGPPRVLREVRA